MVAPTMPVIATHGLRRMDGRDPDAEHRTATPLELLFDLVFVIAFGVAGSEFAHQLAAGDVGDGLIGFSFAMFAVIWAWVNFTWFASAYDTDDWAYRLWTMVQMTGVVVLALGLPAMFESIGHDEAFDNRAMIFGYVVMRVPMAAQWLRAAHDDPGRRRTCRTYASMLIVGQAGWVVLAFLDLRTGAALAAAAPLLMFEVVTPWIAERQGGTPWHPHHIAERYGLMAIIALGEVLVGTVAALGAVVDGQGWSVDVAVLALAGVGLTFGLWWTYFLVPTGEILAERRRGGFVFGYGHMPLYAAIAATGAGLHVAALYLEHRAEISATAVVWTIAVPVSAYFFVATALHSYLARLRPRVGLTLASKIGVVLLAVVLSTVGVELVWCVLVISLAPAISVLDLELTAARRARGAHHRPPSVGE